MILVSPTHSSQFLFHPFREQNQIIFKEQLDYLKSKRLEYAALEDFKDHVWLHLTLVITCSIFHLLRQMFHWTYIVIWLPGNGQSKSSFRSPSLTSKSWPRTAKARGNTEPKMILWPVIVGCIFGNLVWLGVTAVPSHQQWTWAAFWKEIWVCVIWNIFD